MSRHRNFRHMNYDDERDDNDDEDFHRISISADDDDFPMSPGTAQFIYRQPKYNGGISPTRGVKISDFLPEERDMSALDNDVVDDNEERQFQLENVPATTSAPSPVVFSISQVAELNKGSGSSPVINKESRGRIQPPAVENLRISEIRDFKSDSFGGLTSNASSQRLSALALAQATPTTTQRIRVQEMNAKTLINLVIVGHVDAGKSTLMGHLLYQLGCVDDRTIRKYKMESAKTGKASFAFAWVLDDTQEERQRGITMDIATTSFETATKRIHVLDAPGHKDFIPNMITGAAQADAALLVANATRGEFETGFGEGGQTREHAMLLRALGVNQLIVVVNKLDTVEWSSQRYEQLLVTLKNFLQRQAGFSRILFVPVSGLAGDNLVSSPASDHPLLTWYKGPCLIDLIDKLESPIRAGDRPLRAVINDIFKNTFSSLTVSVKVEAGQLGVGEKVFIMPNAEPAIIKGVSSEGYSCGSTNACFSGEHAVLTLNAVNNFQPDSILPGQILSCGGKNCLVPAKRFLVRLVVFNIVIPIMKGTKAELYAHSLCEPCKISKLHSVLNKSNGQVSKRNPRCLTRNTSGMVEIETSRAVCLETYAECKALGRITLRSAGQTIAAGIIEQVVSII